MTKSKWYSLQLSRHTISRLYILAKAKGIAMTKLADALIARALDQEQGGEIRPSNEQRDTKAS
jgi:hypothetical protein